jgi:hypothetical protein
MNNGREIVLGGGVVGLTVLAIVIVYWLLNKKGLL